MKIINKPTIWLSVALYCAIVIISLSLMVQSSRAQSADSDPIVDTGQKGVTMPDTAIAPRAGVERPPATDAGQPITGGQGPDLAAAASQLGVTEDALQAARGEPGQGPPDFAAAAQTLGETEEALMAALGQTAGNQPMGSQRPAGGPPANAP